MDIRAEIVTVHTKRTFAIARSSADTFERVVFELEDGNLTGRGEAEPTNYYGQNAEDARSALETAEIKDPWNIEGTLRENAHLPPASLAALDAALHDLTAKRLGVPVYRLLGLGRPTPTTAYTLGIADRQTTLEAARELSRSGFPIFKMKVGGREDIETVRAVAQESDAAIWVDANEAFSTDDAPDIVRELVEMGVAMIEQPVPATEGSDALKAVTEAAGSVPLIADESAITARDVPKLAGCVSGVNVKLAKCGGIRGAIAMIQTARAHDMKVMLGCMVETSLGIAAAAHVSDLVDFVDLDGALLLADDPFEGLGYENGRILLPDRPGLGVNPA